MFFHYLKQYISKQGISGQVKIWVTGYSRAAATANLVSGELDKGIALGNDILVSEKKMFMVIVLKRRQVH